MVAPTYDHASSLGRELRDERRLALLDANGVGDYVRRGHGGIYLSAASPRGESPLGLLEAGVGKYPDIFGPALKQVCEIDVNLFTGFVSQVPASRMSAPAHAFAIEVLSYSLRALKNLLK
jgi:hypothetical protein